MMREQMKNVLEQLRKMSAQELCAYDVKNECEKLKEIADEDAIAKLSVYRLMPEAFDCDVSLFSMMIYALSQDWVWEQKLKLIPQTAYNADGYKYMFSDGEKNYLGDTMNSFLTPVGEYLILRGICKHAVNGKGYYDMATGEKLVEALQNPDRKKIYEDALKPAKEFLRWNHTIGNLIAVSENFNVPRYQAYLDYWDLTLDDIYGYFMQAEQSQIPVGEFSPEAKAWLDSYGSWTHFIEENQLQPFVEKRENGYGRAKDFWLEHYANVLNKQPNTPTNVADAVKYFETAAQGIKERSMLVALAVQERLQQMSDDEILKKLLDTQS